MTKLNKGYWFDRIAERILTTSPFTYMAILLVIFAFFLGYLI